MSIYKQGIEESVIVPSEGLQVKSVKYLYNQVISNYPENISQLNKPENISQFNSAQQYYNFFKQNNIISDPQNYIPNQPSDEELKKHKIKFLNRNQFQLSLHSHHQPYIRVKNTQRNGTIAIYNVIIGMFQLEITLLNIDQNADKQKQQNKIGSGGFGSVRVQSQNKRMFAVKRQIFQEKYHLKEFNMMANKQEINEAIKQLSIYKICSLLKIGPAAETEIGFDLICYRDCIEFQIQYCLKILDQKQRIYVDQSKFEKQIKKCLLSLHYYGIIHKDIKPANILFSIKYNKYVLTDFGISHPVHQKIGQRTETHCQGTIQYMSKQMLQLQKKVGYIHLYGNDVYSLTVTFAKFKINKNIEQQLKQFNQIIQNKSKQNIKYKYEYLKLKYYCIQPDNKMKEVQHYWKYMNKNRTEQLISIVDKSMKYDKIKSVYNFLSSLQEFKKFNLESLRIQSQSIKNIKIDLNYKQITELQLKNTLRIYGYSQEVKNMILKFALQQKHQHIIQKIDKIIEKNSEYNYRDGILFANHENYIKKIKKNLVQFQEKMDQESMFDLYMKILQYGRKEEQIQVVEKLYMFKFERSKEQNLEQMIRVGKVEKNKENLRKVLQFIKIQSKQNDIIITEKMLYNDVAKIYNQVGDYNKALQYYTKSVNLKLSNSRQQHPSVAVTYNDIADVYDSMGKYEKALQYYTKSVNIMISLYGQQHQSVAVSYNNIADVFYKLENHEKALQDYIKSVIIMISFYGQQHRSVANTYNTIALVYNNMGNNEKALQYYTKSINMKISLYGQQHPSVADTYNNMAVVYYCIRQYEKALQYYTKSINMKISLYGQQHISVVDTYNNMAVVYKEMGNFEKALQIYTKSVNINISLYGQQHSSVAEQNEYRAIIYSKSEVNKKALVYQNKVVKKIACGEKHPPNNLANIYNQIAVVYNDMGNYEKALQYWKKRVNINISIYGQQHYSVAESYNNIAVVYKDMGNYEKALQIYTKSVNMRIQLYGQQHSSVAESYNNIAVVYNRMGNYEKALQIYTKSVNMRISLYGQQHSSVAESYNNIAVVYKDMGNYEKALQIYTKSVNMRIQLYGQQHSSVAESYNNIAVVYDRMGKYEKALQYWKKSVNINISIYGQQHSSVADTYNNIAVVYNRMGKFQKALQIYTKSVNMKISLYGQQHPSVAVTYNNLAVLYNDMGKYEKALQYWKKRVNINISIYGQQHSSVADTYYNIAAVYYYMRQYEKVLKYYTKSVNINISLYGQQHPSVSSVSDIFFDISSTYLLSTQLTQSLKYCNKSIKIRSNLLLMQYPQMAKYYDLLSCIFKKKEKYIKSLNYEYSALNTFLKFSHFDNHNSPYYLLKLADIYYKMNRFIQSHFFCRMSCQISVKYFPIHDNNVRNSRNMMNEIEWSMPSLIHNYTSNIQFMNNISIKYNQVSKHKLMKLLLSKKWQLRFEQQHRSRRDIFQYLKCLIEIYLCYKYIGYPRQMNKAGEEMKEQLIRYEQSQQKSMFRELISLNMSPLQ